MDLDSVIQQLSSQLASLDGAFGKQAKPLNFSYEYLEEDQTLQLWKSEDNPVKLQLIMGPVSDVTGKELAHCAEYIESLYDGPRKLDNLLS